MGNKNLIKWALLSLLPIIILLGVFFVYGSNLFSYNNQVEQGLNKYGSVCVSTTGDFEGRKTHPHQGEIELVDCSSNLVVNAGLNATRDLIGQGTVFGAFNVIGLCNATAACNTPAAGDTTIESEYTSNGLTRAAGDYNTIGGSPGNWTISHTFTSSGISNLQTNKTCLTNQTAVAGSTVFACNTFTLVTLDGTQSDTLLINWTNYVTSG